jgi:hypothetical protein
MSADWYAPNQQAVRADESGPAEQGSGGAGPPPETPEREPEPQPVAEKAEDSGKDEEEAG